MKKTVTMRILVLLMAAVMVMLAGCEVSSTSTSTTTVTTSKTDADGNTTTNTVTTEVGVTAGTNGISTTSQTTTETTESSNTDNTEPADEEQGFTAEDLRAAWQERYAEGAKGTSKYGDTILFAYDDPDGMNYAALMIISEDGEHLSAREGEIVWDEENEYSVLRDVDMDSDTPFNITDGDGETFTMVFPGDGDEAVMTVMDQDSIIEEMLAVWIDFTSDAA